MVRRKALEQVCFRAFFELISMSEPFENRGLADRVKNKLPFGIVFPVNKSL